MSPAELKPKFDPVKLITQAFSYVKHFRLMLICFALAILAGISYFLYATPVYQARSLVYFQAFGSVMKNSEVQETVSSTARLSRSLIDRLNSQHVKIGAAQRLGILDTPATYEDLLEVVPVLRVSIIDARHLEVTVQAYDPEVVRNFTGALVAEFQESQEESWKEFRDDALERYAVQVAELEEKVLENVNALSELERDQSFTEVSIEQQNLLQIPKEIVETRERLKRMDSIRETLLSYEESAPEGGESDTAAILSLLSEFENETVVEVGNVVQRSLSGQRNPVRAGVSELKVVQPSDIEGLEPWRELEKQKRLLESQIEEASKTFLPDHPKMQELNAKLASTRRALETERDVLREKFDLEYQRLAEKLDQLQERIPEYQKVTEELGKSSLEYASVEQAQKMWQTAQEKLSEKLATITFAEDFDWIQLRFKEHTSLRDTNPISPNKRKLVIFSILLGLAGAIGLPTVLNLMDTSASTVHELEELLHMKGIGIVPLSDPEFLEAVHRSPAQGATVPNYLLECFRVIRANIGLDVMGDSEIESQVILVTSARPQEGKTTQAANLAWAYHSMGERVLLIDCDLRRGRVHRLLDLENADGLSHLLTGAAGAEDAIRKTAENGFDAIPRGPIIPGSTELLCQDVFSDLVARWRKDYDRIILDCPPVLGLSESTSLQRLADGIVFVIRSEETSTKDVRDAIAMLRKTGAHFYGFVLNGVDLSKVGNYYQYYYYSAPYYDQFEEDPPPLDNSPSVSKALPPPQRPARPGSSDDPETGSLPNPSPDPSGEAPPLPEQAEGRRGESAGTAETPPDPEVRKTSTDPSWVETPEEKDWLHSSGRKS